jgi:carboxylesterase type B
MSIVRVDSGEVLGSMDGGNHVFRGIPYAEPLDALSRWLPPKPRRPWEGIRDARAYGPGCPQFAGEGARLLFPGARSQYALATAGARPASEGDDSLLLNVWSASLDRDARLPVMVWIHGGGFANGAANEFYDGGGFADRGVVAVTIQYRLGPLGFLHGAGLFEGEVCADNRAFLDQLEALRWVHDNIAQFGGDPANVTLFGESAGAFAVYQLCASPQGKGLFRRAIAMGGMAGTCAPADEYHRLTRDALADVGVRAGDTQALASLDAKRLMRLHLAATRRALKPKHAEQYGSLSRAKVGFLGAATGTPFLPKPPLQTYPEGTPNDIDLMLGTCANDGALFSLLLPFLPALSARLFSQTLLDLMPGRDMQAVRSHYRRHMRGASWRQVYDQINNDAFYRMPTLAAAAAHAGAHPGRTWHYQLDYRSSVPGLGAIHGIDVVLLFRPASGELLLAQDEGTAQLTKSMREAFTAFAKSGTPAAAGLPQWKPFERQTRYTMVLDRQSHLAADLDPHLREYWLPG